MDTDSDIYKAEPQIRGKNAHETIDNKKAQSRKNEMHALPVISDELGIMGVIDIYRVNEKSLIERKYQLKQIFRGHLYQIWAQYYCMIEMGYEVKSISFYEISRNKTIGISLPGDENKAELSTLIRQYKSFDPSSAFQTNPRKCSHCIYCNLCDKTDRDNVYE